MTGDTHYDLEILAELAEGLLDADTARQVREHLAVCTPCGAFLADLAAVREVLAATPTPAMPMGVTLRIDKALAEEAQRGAIGLAEKPDWDELMRDAPWEQPAAEAPEPVRLGVVSDDGTIVPARTRASRRRRWALPAMASAAAAVVVGGTVLMTSGVLTTASNSPQQGGTATHLAAEQPPAPPAETGKGRGYALTDSNWNYSDSDLKRPMVSFLGNAEVLGGAKAADVTKCVNRVAARSKIKPFAVDQGQYNGSEALIVASWRSQPKNQVRLDIVDPFSCKNLRKPTLGRW
ncbi:anti-sigma factor family protein [Nonomuraea longicatena]|uniref:Putative zinc-finger domain-containing protein n=1 Tax=Nonomuraea longicatena TaxID=83682 RepID=A0ABN1NTT3_9ACTN